ncbi:MAG: cyclic nucleotide-binding/CBS domain-containing protein [Gemmatimonadota bacterium]
MERRKLLIASAETTVSEAARRMADKQVGALLVVEDKRLVGIFTERDALFRVIAKGLEPGKTRLADVMTRDPKTISPDKTFGLAMLVMNENRFRHLPVIENGRLVGIVSARDALDPDLEEFVAEERRRKQFAARR